MRALSIRQPWAALILAGAKPVENRSWSTSYRGPLIVHAGRRRAPVGRLSIRSRPDPDPVMHSGTGTGSFEVAGGLGVGVPIAATATGAYVGVVELVDVHAGDGCCEPWGEPETMHWILTHPIVFDEPMMARGQLGLYRPPDDVVARCREVAAASDGT